MKHVLYVGQRFRLLPFSEYGGEPKLPNVVHKTEWSEAHNLRLKRRELTTASSYEDSVTQGGGGNRKGRRLSTRYKGDYGSFEWTVEKTSLGGGGTGHGPHDVYPDGHLVVAKSGAIHLSFAQTGCFNGMVPPHAVELINGDEFPDQPTRFEMRQVQVVSRQTDTSNHSGVTVGEKGSKAP